MGDLAKTIIQRHDKLKGDRGTWESHWQEIADYMIPERSEYVTRKTPGQKRMGKIYDATPVLALEQFAAGLHSLLTSPSLRWFTLKTRDDRLNMVDAVRLWLEDTTERMYSIFNGPRHNFASQSNELYLDIGSIGTGVMAVLESRRSNILFTTRHLRECVIAENEEDRIDTLIRSWKYTAKQAVQAWPVSDLCPQGCGDKIMKAAETTPDQMFTFMHAVRPRLNRNPDRADERRHMPYESVYINVDNQEEISESGFPEFPYMVPRFSKITGETYGRGPGMMVLPDVKMLNAMTHTVLQAAQKIVDPPLQIPDSGFIMPIKTLPGAWNYYRRGLPQTDRISPIETRGNIPIGVELIAGIRQQIIRGFYVEWMMMPSDPQDPAAAGKGITATYVLQQRDEKMRLLSPMLARLQSEFLSPLIDRVFNMMFRQARAMGFRAGAPLLPPPAELAGADLRVEYVSPIAIAQQSSQMENIMRLLQLTQMVMPIDQKVGIVIDGKAVIRSGAKILNTPPSMVKSPDQVAAEEQQQAEVQQAMAAHMSAESMAGTAKDASQAMKNAAAAKAQGGGAIADTGGGGGAMAEAA